MTNDRPQTDGLLTSFRALDLTDEKGFLCGRILADLGVDVIKVEEPGGDPGRNTGPFYHDIPHPEKSLYWFAYNAGKRGITLDIEKQDGREIFKRLAKSADFVIESFAPGHMDALDLGYCSLSVINPRLIMTSISAFGQTGPYKDYQDSDLVAVAMGGLMYITGESDRPPVRIGVPQAYVHAGAQAALGTLIAHYYREISGEGQHVDVSMQDSVIPTLINARLFGEFGETNMERAGAYRRIGGGALQRVIWRCQDGYVSFSLWGGQAGAHSNRQLVEWMDGEGFAPDFLKTIDWNVFDISTTSQEEQDRLSKPIGEFFRAHTKTELFKKAVERGIMFYPVQDIKDIVQDPHLAARKFWVTVDHEELGAVITYPGAFAQFSESPCSTRRRAPLIGEHNEEIYQGELGFPSHEVTILKQAGVI